METSLRFDSAQRKLFLHAKENFVSDDNVVLTVSGKIATDDGRFSGKAKLRRKFFPEINTRVDMGAKYESDIEQLSYGASARKTFELSSDGLLSVDLKVRRASAQQTRRARPRCSRRAREVTDGRGGGQRNVSDARMHDHRRRRRVRTAGRLCLRPGSQGAHVEVQA